MQVKTPASACGGGGAGIVIIATPAAAVKEFAGVGLCLPPCNQAWQNKFDGGRFLLQNLYIIQHKFYAAVCSIHIVCIFGKRMFFHKLPLAFIVQATPYNSINSQHF